MNAPRPLIVDAAERTCSRKERTALAHKLDGRTSEQAAALMGEDEAAVKVMESAAVAKVEAALSEPVARAEPLTADVVKAWFSSLPPSREGLFGSLAVLLVMHFAADAKRSGLIADLSLYLPRRIVGAALGQLRAAGYIATDGVTYTIRRTPLTP